MNDKKKKFGKHIVTVSVNWKENAKRYYVTAVCASTNEKAKDNIVFLKESFERIIALNKFNMFTLLHNFNTNRIIGNAKITGIEHDSSCGIFKAIANLIVVAPMQFAQNINKMGCAIAMNNVKGYKKGDKKFIESFDIVNMSLIDIGLSVDKYCIVKEILKDEDIDKRLES